jgi:tripartite ATP-independent transporter DctM subunit
VAVAYAVAVGLLVLRTLKLSDLPGIFYRSMLTTSTILMVMACANIFSWILGTEMIPQKVAKVITSLSENPYVLLLLINLLLFVVGCFLEGLAAIIIMVPILLPIAQHAGIDPIHFGIVVVMNLMIGLITPPLGLCLFVCCSVSKVDLVELVRANMPFLLVELATLFLVAYVPQVVLFLPRLFGY